jgi:hypothetical protein
LPMCSAAVRKGAACSMRSVMVTPCKEARRDR